MCLFNVLFDEWQAAAEDAASAFQDLWDDMDQRDPARRPSLHQVAVAMRLKLEALEVLGALRQELHRERARITVL